MTTAATTAPPTKSKEAKEAHNRLTNVLNALEKVKNFKYDGDYFYDKDGKSYRGDQEISKEDEDFEYCTGYMGRLGVLAIWGEPEKNQLHPKLTLRDIKILETGLEKYKGYLRGTATQHIARSEQRRPFPDETEIDFAEYAQYEYAECNKILEKLRAVQKPIFDKLTKEQVSHMYCHKIIGPGYWTSGGTIQ